jgi:hypothetical protein
MGPRRRSQVLQGFGGSLEELPFVDLVQAFARSQRSVRIQLESRKGERALVHMRRGRIVHAVCGKLSGADAVYGIIAWGDLGRFSSVPASMFPTENVTESTDTLLFEGCRRLDEGRR